MDYNELKKIYDANKDRLNTARIYLKRYEVTDKDYVSAAIRGYSEARKNDLILIPNNFEGEIVNNISNWAFGRGFTISTETEKDKEKIENMVNDKNLKVLAKNLSKKILATGSSLMIVYADSENEEQYFVPKPDMTIYLTNSFGDVDKFAFFYWRQEEKGYRLYADAFDSKEVTKFKSSEITTLCQFLTLPKMNIEETKSHFFKKTPAVNFDAVYPAYYQVIPLIDAYNKLLTETNDQFSAFKAAILALRNLIVSDKLNEEIENDDKAKEAYDKITQLSVLFLGDEGQANFLKREVQTDAFKTLEKVLNDNISRFSGNINYADPEVLGKATNLAINTRTKPISNRAQDLTDLFHMQFKKLLKITNNFLTIRGKSIDVDKLQFEFNYDKPSNQPEEAETVQKLINSAVPYEYAYQQFSGFSNPETVANKAKEEENAKNPTPAYE